MRAKKKKKQPDRITIRRSKVLRWLIGRARHHLALSQNYGDRNGLPARVESASALLCIELVDDVINDKVANR
jgi:hypothetical protein